MKDFINRLSSRKFLITIGGILAVTLYPQFSDSIITLIGIYVGGEGVADAVQRYSSSKYIAPKQIDLTHTKIVEGLIPDEDRALDGSRIIQPGNIN
jgi:hypothetical protein